MKSNFELCLAQVLSFEGGYSDDPQDPGGCTNRGVTIGAWAAFVGRPVRKRDMRSLSLADVTPFYKQAVWDKVRGDDLPTGLDFAIFDFAVNSGVSRGAKTLQKAAGVVTDGQIGPKTLAALTRYDPAHLTKTVSQQRLAFLQTLPTWERFGRGWATRVNSVSMSAIAMACGKSLG